eukprot:TRINITY_DN2765_c0_g1_i2.p1 TRINITY_DN2765_c0_g1~~TRINITY_DN2765_c0_g1_i2.p1  ORF type:complete len:177 (+),score=40.38 TRINITY_DN2765_c0_g1_i2:150-680(+)
MISILKQKEEQRKREEEQKKKDEEQRKKNGEQPGREDHAQRSVILPSVLRIQTDIVSLGQDLKDHIKYSFDPSNPLKMELTITPPKDSLWKGGVYKMSLEFPENYPFHPPKATCLTKIFHPNIEYSGGVCSNILRKDWSPAFNLQVIFNALLNLFVEPVADDPLNKGFSSLVRNVI